MRKTIFVALGLFLVGSALPVSALAMNHSDVQKSSRHHKIERHHPPAPFQHVATFDVMAENGSGVAEIIDATRNGKQLVYTDGENGAIGFVDISNPAEPEGQGTVEVGGEPTSLVVLGPLVLVGVNTSSDYVTPSGRLVVVNRYSRKIVAVHELGGQPDSLALAPDHRRLAIVIENERDEDLNDGIIPQNETGKLLIVNLRGPAKRWKIKEADLAPVAAAAPAGSDLEPEFVDINSQNEAVVTFQENNYLAVVNMVTGKTKSHFSAGEVELKTVDTEENDLIEFNSNLTKRAEPDAVAWLDDDTFATANEGDYEDASGEGGGARGFTIFNKYGKVKYESGESFELWLASAGHYNEGRSENKGCEPEAVEMGTFGRGHSSQPLLFVGSERCDAVGVYDVSRDEPKPLQLLPTGIGPEGLKVIPQRNLFVASTETDVADAGIPTMINIYQFNEGRDAKPAYPMIVSGPDADDLPIPWVALSGLVGDPEDPTIIYGVSDAFLAEGFIYTVDVSREPAVIIDRLQVTGADPKLDLEGIAVGPDGNFWLASEGNADDLPNRVLKVDSNSGAVKSEIELPAGLEANSRKNGFEGIAVTGASGSEVVYVAIQRAWPDSGDADKEHTKIGRYRVADGEWEFIYYPLEAETDGGWIGLSELTLLPDGTFAVIERDKGWGPTTGLNASLKAVFNVELAGAEFKAYDDADGLETISKTLLVDVLPDLEKTSIWTAEKLEGLAVAADGQMYAVTDNDGLDDATGETVFLDLGPWSDAAL